LGTAAGVDQLIHQLEQVNGWEEAAERLITSADPTAQETGEGWQVTVGEETAVIRQVSGNWQRVTASD
jgi:hypothetical protein